ncbi:hypothetical protein F5148DRAFT_1160727 [Russula earlei]|uniref:Uncharacterized protein n=1 Tax=Russula earlei TaxID=71964 RepID=A0ACC0UN45_9AGAM|nr:hypothetical protein F5148DRAFT_1160727 [Russula earlei]
MLRAGRATTSYLRRAILGAQVVAIVSKIWKIWDGFHKELYLYGHPLHLQPLQGRCVPNIIGVFSTTEGLANIAMEPPHPHAWRVADRSLSVAEKSAIVEAYTQIHARGVLHGDVALRHMLIGRDGKPTIINFRHASCLQPAMQIGLSGCDAHEFQLEMRQVKFLLDYQGARESEYRLARENHPASRSRMNTREQDTFITRPIPELTLRQWDSSTNEDLSPPPLPFYIPGAPDISIRPVFWIPGDEPPSADDPLNPDSETNHLSARISPEIFPVHDRLSQKDDDEFQSPPCASPSHSRLKGKQPERYDHSDIAGPPLAQKHKRFHLELTTTETEQLFSDIRHHIFDQRGHHVAGTSLTSCNHFELTASMTNLEPGTPVAPQITVFSLDPSPDGAAPLDEFPTSPSQLSHDIEGSLLFSWPPILHTSSHLPPPDHAWYSPRLSPAKPEESIARHELTPQLDYSSDSPSDASVSETDTPYGWADSKSSSPEGALLTLQDEVPPFPIIDYSEISFLCGPSSDINIKFTESSLETLQPALRSRESISSPHKRKRLFLNEEDGCGERRKRRSIEQ